MRIKPHDPTEWSKIDGDNTYRIDYPLNHDSIIVDIGARHGHWVDKIVNKVSIKNIFCFEVMPEFCLQLREKGYQTFKYAISDTYGYIDLGVVEGEASIYQNGTDVTDKVIAHSLPASQIFLIIHEPHIDLMKINVEGAEYPILQNLIHSGTIKNITDLQVQFHDMEGYEGLYEEIAKELSKTHQLTWRFPFVWENWHKI